MRTPPYIGITDFDHPDQVTRMLRVFNEHRQKRSKRKLHVGVMMSRRTLNKETPEDWAVYFPPNEDIPGIFHSDKTFNCIHYADFGNDPMFMENLIKAIACGGAFIDAIQLDMVWPDPALIAGAIHASRKQLRVILQVGTKAMDAIGGDYREMIRRLDQYSSVVHYVLFDKSMGKGLTLDVQETLSLWKNVRVDLPQFQPVIAGGLYGDNIDIIKPITSLFPEMSIDAQGKLRPSGDKMDPLDMDFCEEYLIRGCRLLK